MKILFFFIFLTFTYASNAQDTNKDNYKLYNSKTMVYDAHIGKHLNIEPNAKPQKNPYKFADKKAVVIDTKTKQLVYKPKKKESTKK